MIIDHISCIENYYKINALFQNVNDFIVNKKYDNLAVGRHEIIEDKLYAIISKGNASESNSVKLEIHKKFIDLHYVVEGEDVIGYSHISKCVQPIGEFDVGNDYLLFNDTPSCNFKIEKNFFSIFFPGDAHSPLNGSANYYKIVFKIII
jgi:YhcH/YjgK/YiaL family protein